MKKTLLLLFALTCPLLGQNAINNPTQVPASANGLSSNSSQQIVASTAHNIAVPLTCAAASANTTAYTCATVPTFTPADGDAILFEADLANTAAVTLNVNSSSAAGVKKQGGGTALVANDLLAGQNVLMIFDGTNWQMQGQTGNNPSLVTSVFGRTGGVTATSGDYTAAQVTNAADKASASTQSFSAPEVDIGPQDTASNGIIGLKGKTSGTATFTAPAVAGTTSNPVVSSNAISVPSITFPSAIVQMISTSATFGWQSGSGASTASADFRNSGYFKVGTGVKIGWASGDDAFNQGIVTNINTPATGIVQVGGSAADATGKFKASAYIAAEAVAPAGLASSGVIWEDSTTHEFGAETNGSSSAGMLVRAQPGQIHSTANAAAISTATLCAASAGACNVAGQYHITFTFVETGTACGTPATGGVTFLLTWTDSDGNAHSAVSLGMDDASAINAVSQTFHFQTAKTAAWASGDFNISTNGTIIQYATGYTACGVGTGQYTLDITVTRLQ